MKKTYKKPTAVTAEPQLKVMAAVQATSVYDGQGNTQHGIQESGDGDMWAGGKHNVWDTWNEEEDK